MVGKGEGEKAYTSKLDGRFCCKNEEKYYYVYEYFLLLEKPMKHNLIIYF